MLLKPCGRCRALIPYGVGYCDTCAPIIGAYREERLRQAKLKSNRNYNKSRDPKYTQFYNSQGWRVLSVKRLQDGGYRCEWCGAIATEVDHIIEIKTGEGWDKRLDYDNLRPLCHACHDKRHNRFKKRFEKRSETRSKRV